MRRPEPPGVAQGGPTPADGMAAAPEAPDAAAATPAAPATATAAEQEARRRAADGAARALYEREFAGGHYPPAPGAKGTSRCFDGRAAERPWR
jgi:hypothetical protein